MKNSTILRNLMLELCEVGESISSYGYALKLMKALSANEITGKQFDLLSDGLYLHCRKNKNVFSLFAE